MARRNSKVIPTVLTQDDFVELDENGALGNFGGYKALIYARLYSPDSDTEADEPEDEDVTEGAYDSLAEAIQDLNTINTWNWSVFPVKAAEINTQRNYLIGADEHIDARTGDLTSYTAFITKLDDERKEHKLNVEEVQFVMDKLTNRRRFRREV